MMAAFIPFLVGLNSFVYNFIFQTLFLSEIEKSYFFLVNIAILGLLYHFRTLWSLYLVIIFYTYSLFIQFLLLQTQLGDDQSYSTYNFIYWGFSTLVILLPILYLIAEGLPIIKTLKNNETNDNPTILDANQ